MITQETSLLNHKVNHICLAIKSCSKKHETFPKTTKQWCLRAAHCPVCSSKLMISVTCCLHTYETIISATSLTM